MQLWAIVLTCFSATFLFANPAEVDESFKPQLPSNCVITAVCEQEDGKLLVGGVTPPVIWDYEAFLVRLRPDGKIDPSFRVPWRKLTTFDTAAQIVGRPDKKIGVLGWNHLYRLRPFGDGTGDVWGEVVRSFRGAALLRSHGEFDRRYSAEEDVGSGSFFPDGSILYQSTTNQWLTRSGSYAQLKRIDPEGHVVWSSEAIFPHRPDWGLRTSFAWCRALPDGTVVGGVVNPVSDWQTSRFDYRWTRYYLYSSTWGLLEIGGFGGRPDGDHSYGVVPSGPGHSYGIVAPGPTNSLYLGAGPNLGILTRRIVAWQIDPSFNFQSPQTNGTLQAMVVQPDGRIVFCFISDSTNQLYRCNTDGSFDSSFSFGEQGDAAIQNLVMLRGGKILAWGSYTDSNSIQRQTFVRLNAD